MLLVRMKRRVTMAFWVLIHVLTLPIPKDKSLPFHRLKLTVISKNFRYTSYNFCICDTTRITHRQLTSVCFASFQALNLNGPTVRRYAEAGYQYSKQITRQISLLFSVANGDPATLTIFEVGENVVKSCKTGEFNLR